MDSALGLGQARPAFVPFVRAIMSAAEHPNFVKELLKLVPQWVKMALATGMGMAIAFAMILSTTGLQAPFNRIVDAYAKRIEMTVTRLELATDDMTVIASRLEASEENMKRLGLGVETLANRQQQLEIRTTELAAQLKDLDSRVRVLEHGVREAKK